MDIILSIFGVERTVLRKMHVRLVGEGQPNSLARRKRLMEGLSGCYFPEALDVAHTCKLKPH